MKPNPYSVRSLTNRQKNITKGHLIDSCNKAYGIFPSFSSLNPEFTPGFYITGNFSDHFSFNLVNKKEKDKICAQELNKMVLRISSSPSMALVITDASIKNDIATSISHIYLANHPLIKTVYHTVFITSTEVELFTIRYGINQVCIKKEVSKLSLILSMLQRKYLIANHIHTNLTLQPFLASCVISSKLIKKIPLNSGNPLIVSNGGFTMTSTKIPNYSIRLPLSHARSLGIIARKLTVMTSLTSGR